ncbi:hypothetical protein HMPREF0043_00556 [Actinobaculum sp. oral taxon 183 str. F0552]|nr:hypothetical protein HMPREF0043_00556 [Actinobaculum sp. oral taxon 183 str. F0552]
MSCDCNHIVIILLFYLSVNSRRLGFWGHIPHCIIGKSVKH